MGIFSRAANAYADAKQNAKAQQDAEQQRMFQKMALELGLRERGILPAAEAQQMQGAAQAAKAGAFLMPGGDLMTSGVETPQVQQVGPGYSRVSTLTPEYKAQVKERVQQRRAKEAEQSFQGLLNKAMAGDEAAKAAVIAQRPSLANSVFKPKSYRTTTTGEGVYSYDTETGQRGTRLGSRPHNEGSGGTNTDERARAKEHRTYVSQRTRELMRPTDGDYGMKTPGLAFAEAQRQALAEADEIYGAATVPGAAAAKPAVTGLDTIPEAERTQAAQFAQMIRDGHGTIEELRNSETAKQNPRIVAVTMAILKRQ